MALRQPPQQSPIQNPSPPPRPVPPTSPWCPFRKSMPKPQPTPIQYYDQRPQQTQQTCGPIPQQPLPLQLPGPPSPIADLSSFHGQREEVRQYQLYAAVKALDPSGAEPNVIVHLLVKAALHDRGLAEVIYNNYQARLHSSPNPQPPNWGPPTTIDYPPHNPPFHGPAILHTSPNTPVRSPRGPIPPHQASPGQSGSSIGPVASPAQCPEPGVRNGPAAADINTNDYAIELDYEPPEPYDEPCDFTWVYYKAKEELNWISETQQTRTGCTAVLRLKTLQKYMSDAMDRYMEFVSRVHILSVMGEIMVATLGAGARARQVCHESARNLDDDFVRAVRKLTPDQRRRLNVLDGGVFVRELRKLIHEAESQCMFPRLPQALAYIKS